ncbi:MAG TPA: two-component sensor histidine kinase [Ignavibacteriales bacterium]|nr:two-component sensor histidine kinase [Ignavibacteriales bacterium]
MWNEIKSNIYSASVYFREFILFLVFVVVIIFLLIEKLTLSIPLILLLLVTGFIILNLIGRRRIKEIDEIKNIIASIRKSIYKSSDEIILSEHLSGLENEIKEMFEKAKNDIEYLERLQRMRSQFLANVSHELRTPIFSIQGFIETLLNGAIDDPKVNRHFLQKANQNTVNLSNLLNDLIDISMIESGEMRMSYRYFDINNFIQNILNEFIPLAEEKSIKLIFNPSKEGLQVFGDKDKLRQVLVNLLQNAIKYTDEGSIEILLAEEKKFVNISVRDTGIGIPEADLNRIFERFYRVDKARSRAVGGTGLGLAIAKHIIEAHNSKIIVQSTLGEGSIFSFMLKK